MPACSFPVLLVIFFNLLFPPVTVAFVLSSPLATPNQRSVVCLRSAIQNVIGEILPTLDPTLKVTRVSVEDPSAERPVCGYLVEAEIYGPDVKKTYNQALKAGTLNANFPGFRKGIMPPHALVGVKLSAVTASIMDACRTAMEMHGLENFPANERKLRMKVPQSTEELAKQYELGTDLTFACEIDAIGVPGKATSLDTTAEGQETDT